MEGSQPGELAGGGGRLTRSPRRAVVSNSRGPPRARRAAAVRQHDHNALRLCSPITVAAPSECSESSPVTKGKATNNPGYSRRLDFALTALRAVQ